MQMEGGNFGGLCLYCDYHDNFLKKVSGDHSVKMYTCFQICNFPIDNKSKVNGRAAEERIKKV